MIKRRLKLGWSLGLAALLFLACACEPEATPLPGNLPTRAPATATAEATPALVRYAIAPDALPYLAAEDQTLISASAEIIALDAPPAADDLGTRYDIVVALGSLPDSTLVPEPLRVSLIFDTSLPPLDDAEIELIVYQTVDPQAIARALGVPPEQAGAAPSPSRETLRARLANAGYPDGFDLTLAAFAPGAETLVGLLEAIGVHARIVTDADEAAHLTLTTELATDALTILTIPIRYRAVDGLSITFTPSGFPIVSR
jgi:hypothetical protein